MSFSFLCVLSMAGNPFLSQNYNFFCLFCVQVGFLFIGLILALCISEN